MQARHLLFSLLFVSSTIAAAAAAEAPAVLNGLRQYASALESVRNFERWPDLAPAAAPLQFVLVPLKGEISVDWSQAVVRLSKRDGTVDIQPSAQGIFSLPAQADSEGELSILGRPSVDYAVRAWVQSPNLPADAKRLGDLRLACEIDSAILAREATLLQRGVIAFFANTNHCRDPKSSFGFEAPRHIAKLTLVHAQRRLEIEELPHGKFSFRGSHYVLPLSDTSWPDDTLVLFEFRQHQGIAR